MLYMSHSETLSALTIDVNMIDAKYARMRVCDVISSLKLI